MTLHGRPRKQRGWKTEWPQALGTYLFYGGPTHSYPRLMLVRVERSLNGVRYYLGHYLLDPDADRGYFHRLESPTPSVDGLAPIGRQHVDEQRANA
jgi:hypothetical protein